MIKQVSGLWKDIDELLQEIAPKRQKELQPGMAETELNALEKRLGGHLPDDYKASIALHNGATSLNEYTYLPLESVAEIWDAMNESEAAGDYAELKVDAPEAKVVKSVWWHKGYVPFAQDGAGNLLCIDLDPGPKGVKGQIVKFERNMGPTPTAHASFTDWLSTYRDALKAGKFKKGADQYLRDVEGT